MSLRDRAELEALLKRADEQRGIIKKLEADLERLDKRIARLRASGVIRLDRRRVTRKK